VAIIRSNTEAILLMFFVFSNIKNKNIMPNPKKPLDEPVNNT